MKRLVLAAAIAFGANTALAQDAYLGVGFDFNSPATGDNQTIASISAGVTKDVSILTIGLEAEYGAASFFGGDFDTSRLRLLGYYEIGGILATASVGGTSVSDGTDSYGGYNLGIGMQIPFSDNLDLRGELLRDVMDDATADITTTRIAAIYKF